MEFIPASVQIESARKATRRWNSQHDDQYVPWEWVEEAVTGYLKAVTFTKYGKPILAREWHYRYIEYVNRIPQGLRDTLGI